MAQPVLVDIPGIGTIEAKNAASEHTLNEILKILKKFEKQKLGSGAGGAGGKDKGKDKDGKGNTPTPADKKEEEEKKKTTSTLARMSSTVKSVAGGLIGLGDSITNTISKFANVGDSMTAAAGIFSSIPLVGTAFAAVAGAAESVTKSFQDAASSGATFGGSVNRFAGAASAAGMTMEQFGSFIRSNTEAMIGFGGTTEQGAKRFTEVSRAVRATSSDLYALGFGTKEINQGIANYGKLLRTQGIQEGKSTADLTKGAKAYLKEIDALAKVTGVERSAKEAEMQAAARDAQFQGAMANQSEEVRKSFLSTLGGLAGDMQGPLGNFAKDILATGTATTEENQKLLAQMPRSGAMLQELRAKMQRGEAVTEEERNRLNNLMAEEGAHAAKQLGGTFAAAPEFAGTMNALTLAQSMQKNAITQATAEQKKAQTETDKMNEKISKSKEALAAFSNSFQMALANSGLLDLLMKAFQFTADLVMTYLVPAFQLMGTIISEVGSALIDFLQPIIQQIGDFIMMHVIPAFMDLWPVIQTIGGIIEDYVLPVLTTLGGFILDNILPILVGLGAGLLTYGAIVAAASLKQAYNTMTVVSESGARTGLLTGLAAQIKATWAAAAAALGMSAPMLGIVVAIAAVVAIFYALYKNGWTLGTVFEALKDNIERFGMNIMEFIDMIRSKLPESFGGLSKEETELRAKEREKRRKELDEKEKERDKERAAKVKERGFETKEDQRKQLQFKFDNKKLGIAQAEIKTMDEKLAKEQALSLSDPHAMLKGLAASEKSGFIKDAPAAAATPTPQAAQTAAGATPAGSTAQSTTNASSSGTGGSTSDTASSGSKSPTQDAAVSGLTALNNSMERMIAIQRQTNQLLQNQLRVQENMSGNLSGDLFTSIAA